MEVESLVSQMLRTAESSAQRPYTACVGVQPLAVPEARSEDSESDGGEFDSDVAELEKPPPTPMLARPLLRPVTPQTCVPSTSSNARCEEPSEVAVATAGTEPQPDKPTEAGLAPQTSPKQRRLPQAAVALLMPGQATKLTSAPPPSAAPRVRNSVLLNGGCKSGKARLAPNAAKLQPHASWAYHLPARTCRLQPDARDTEAKAPLAAKAAPVEPLRPVAVVCPSSPEKQDSELTVQASPEPELRRRKGPKYQVAPGGSRPVGFKVAVPRSGERMILEFRTEPRVVPASRNHDRRSTDARSGYPQFRPREQASWVSQRKMLAMH